MVTQCDLWLFEASMDKNNKKLFFPGQGGLLTMNNYGAEVSPLKWITTVLNMPNVIIDWEILKSIKVIQEKKNPYFKS